MVTLLEQPSIKDEAVGAPERPEDNVSRRKGLRAALREKVEATVAHLKRSKSGHTEDSQGDGGQQEDTTRHDEAGAVEAQVLPLDDATTVGNERDLTELRLPDDLTENTGGRRAYQEDDDSSESVEQLRQPEHELPPHTTLTDIIDADAQAHPEEWKGDKPPLFGQKGHIALDIENIGVELVASEKFSDDDTEIDSGDGLIHAIPTSTKSWVVNAYGSRWIKKDGEFILATTSLARLPGLHEAIIKKVLVDEHSRPSKLVTEAAHENVGVYTKEGIILWLETIQEGYSPILATGKFDSDGNPTYLIHDYADYHTVSNLLWGRSTQDRVTKAAEYELKRREANSPQLDNSQPDGVNVIDTITCSQSQINLLDYAMHGPGSSPKENILAAWRAAQELRFLRLKDYEFPDISDDISRKFSEDLNLDPEVAAYNIYNLSLDTNNLEDFIQWYEHAGESRATDDEKAVALEDALIDIARVAEKLLGIYDGTDLQLSRSDKRELALTV